MTDPTPEMMSATACPFEDKNAFEILSVPYECEDDKLIKRSFQKLAMRHHPDKQRDPEAKQAAERNMSIINGAWSAIKTEADRTMYRRLLENPGIADGEELDVPVRVFAPRVEPRHLEAVWRAWVKSLPLSPVGMSKWSRVELAHEHAMRGRMRALHLPQRIVFPLRLSVSYLLGGEVCEETRQVRIEVDDDQSLLETPSLDTLMAFTTAEGERVDRAVAAGLLEYAYKMKCRISKPPLDPAEHNMQPMRVEPGSEELQERVSAGQFLPSSPNHPLELMNKIWQASHMAEKEEAALLRQRHPEARSVHVSSVPCGEPDMIPGDPVLVSFPVLVMPYLWKKKSGILLVNAITGEATGSHGMSGVKTVALAAGMLVGAGIWGVGKGVGKLAKLIGGKLKKDKAPNDEPME